MSGLSAWYQMYPKRATASDLIGKQLVLLDEIAPEHTSFSGMQILTVAEKDKASKRYRLMMTEQEIGVAVDLYVHEGVFSVVPTKEGYVEVIPASKPKAGKPSA